VVGAIQHGPLTIYPNGGTILYNHRPLKLLPSARKVLVYLLRRPGQCCTYRELYDAAGRVPGGAVGLDGEGHKVNVRTMILRLRGSFRELDPEFNLIKTITEYGYMWVDPSKAEVTQVVLPIGLALRTLMLARTTGNTDLYQLLKEEYTKQGVEL
jgi:DNA-binding response OmpR family regulator